MLSVNAQDTTEKLTHVSTITCSNNQTTVQHKLHVASTTGLSASGGDVLADIRSGYDDLALADIVVLDKDNLEEIANIRVVVHNLSNGANSASS